jgi:ABC-2 type transport system ATP-binding protein/lipopolysaccharide transport system ATP-binding protein
VNVIEAENLGKRYMLGEEGMGEGSLRDTLAGLVRRRTHPAAREELWALRNVTFEVPQGETVGLIGRNGAGKSTLLKILARITDPAEGRARVRGRVGALLEVGTAFHPELTGRENIAINGALLGMSRRDIARRFDSIVEFAGVGRFLDTPIKRYSSGMYLRLAFAVAAHFEPDIVVVDEVLAVGDAEFQARCLGKMSELGREGRTVLFVSHDLSAIARLCRRALWLDAGGVREDGPSGPVIDRYLRTAAPQSGSVHLGGVGSGDARVVSVALETASGESAASVARDEPLTVRAEVDLRDYVFGIDLSIWVDNSDGVRVLDESVGDVAELRGALDRPGRQSVAVTFPPLLVPGEYVVGLWLGTGDENYFDGAVLTMRVVARPDDRLEITQRRRVTSPEVHWRVGAAEPQPSTGKPG